MRSRPLALGVLFVSCGLFAGNAALRAQGSPGGGMTTLSNLRDQARPLLIFAPKPDDPRLEIQLRTLNEHAAEAHDRDLIPIALPYNNAGTSATVLSPEDAEAARRRFQVAPSDFAVILIGKDGGAKLRSAKPLSMQKLDDTIDAMPMRKEEMRGKPNQ